MWDGWGGNPIKSCNFAVITVTEMTVGIIVAMKAELEHLLSSLDNLKATDISGMEFHAGTLGGNDVVAMQCGIGKVNAAMGTMLMLKAFAPELIINTGIAGGTGGDAGIMDLVVADEVAFHDVWCGPGNVRGQVQGYPPRFSCAAGNAILQRFKELPGLKHGLIASGDMFVDTPGELQRILTMYPEAVAVDMESGAIAQVCHRMGVPFTILRVVSDYPGADDHIEQYLGFWEKAPAATFAAVRELLEG